MRLQRYRYFYPPEISLPPSVIWIHSKNFPYLWVGMKTQRPLSGLALLGLLGIIPAYAQVVRDTLILRVQQSNEPYRLVFYRVSDGARWDTAAYNSWHLAFEVPGFTAAIRANLGAGLIIWRTNRPATPADWSALSLSDTSARLYDSDTSWSIGAFNTTATSDSFDLGWGNYDLVTHAINGDSLHILRLPDGSYRKLWLERLQGGTYYFKYANLDGTNEVSAQAPKSLAPRRGFVYYNLITQQALNLEPVDSLWDLVFTQYLTFLPPNRTPYPVVGALQNRRVTVARIPLSQNADPDTLSPNLYPYASAINTIGYDWKRFDMSSNIWFVGDTVYYLVRARNGEIWRIRFVAFGDTVLAEGDVALRLRYTVIERKRVASAAALPSQEPATLTIVAYPNPATEGVWIATGEGSPALIRLYNSQGQVVYERQSGGEDFLYIPRQGLSSGLYRVWVQNAKGIGTASILFE